VFWTYYSQIVLKNGGLTSKVVPECKEAISIILRNDQVLKRCVMRRKRTSRRTVKVDGTRIVDQDR